MSLGTWSDGGGISSSSSSTSSKDIYNNILTIIMTSQEIMVSYKGTCRIFWKVGAHYLYVK